MPVRGSVLLKWRSTQVGLGYNGQHGRRVNGFRYAALHPNLPPTMHKVPTSQRSCRSCQADSPLPHFTCEASVPRLKQQCLSPPLSSSFRCLNCDISGTLRWRPFLRIIAAIAFLCLCAPSAYLLSPWWRGKLRKVPSGESP